MIAIIETWIDPKTSEISVTAKEAPMFESVGDFIRVQANRYNRFGSDCFRSHIDSYIYVGF